MQDRDYQLIMKHPTFAGATKDGIEHFFACTGGKLLYVEEGQSLESIHGKNLLCFVLEGSLSLRSADGTTDNEYSQDMLFHFDHSRGHVLKARQDLRLLCFDAARAMIPCGEGCAFHIAFARNLATMIMNKQLIL